MNKLIIIALSALLAAGCVSKKTYEQSLNEKDRKIKEMMDKQGELNTSLEDMKKALAEMQLREEEQKKRLQEFTDLTKRFKRLIDAGTLSVRIVDGKMVVSLGSDVLFPSGSAKLSAKGIQTIKDVTTQLVAISDKKYQVEGHTDNVPIATAAFPSNWELASTRALTVVKTMVQNGMPAERVSAASFGEHAPVKPNDSAESQSQNRRIEIVIVPDLSSLPGYDELQKYSDEKKTPEKKPAEKKATEPTPAPTKTN